MRQRSKHGLWVCVQESFLYLLIRHVMSLMATLLKIMEYRSMKTFHTNLFVTGLVNRCLNAIRYIIEVINTWHNHSKHLQLMWHNHTLQTYFLFKAWNSQVPFTSSAPPTQHAYQHCRALNHPCVTSCNRDRPPGQGRDVEHNDPQVDNHQCVNGNGAAPAVTAVPEESEGLSLSGLWP